MEQDKNGSDSWPNVTVATPGNAYKIRMKSAFTGSIILPGIAINICVIGQCVLELLDGERFHAFAKNYDELVAQLSALTTTPEQGDEGGRATGRARYERDPAQTPSAKGGPPGSY